MQLDPEKELLGGAWKLRMRENRQLRLMVEELQNELAESELKRTAQQLQVRRHHVYRYTELACRLHRNQQLYLLNNYLCNHSVSLSSRHSLRDIGFDGHFNSLDHSFDPAPSIES